MPGKTLVDEYKLESSLKTIYLFVSLATKTMLKGYIIVLGQLKDETMRHNQSLILWLSTIFWK